MKKTILSLSIIAALLVGCGSSSKSNSTEETIIKDPEYLLLSLTYDEGKDGTIDIVEKDSYNKENQIIKIILKFYNETSIYDYIYNKNNNLIKETDKNTKGDINTIKTYSYDKHNNLIKKIYEDKEDNSSDITTYTYDNSNNRLTENDDYDADGDIDYYRTNTYNTKNLLIQKVLLGSDKELRNSISYVYNANNNFISIVETDSEGKLYASESFTYDKNQNLLSKIETDADGEVRNSYYATYNNKNQLEKEIEIKSDTKTTTTYTYDKNSRIATMVDLVDEDNNGAIDAKKQWSFTYESNNHANLIMNEDSNNDGTFDNIWEVKYLLVAKEETKATMKTHRKSNTTPLVSQKMNQEKRFNKVVEKFNKINPNFMLLKK